MFAQVSNHRFINLDHVSQICFYPAVPEGMDEETRKLCGPLPFRALLLSVNNGREESERTWLLGEEAKSLRDTLKQTTVKVEG